MNKKRWLIGIDEAGRGPLAGPVYVGVFAVPPLFNMNKIADLNDSKLLSEKKRNILYDKIVHTEGALYSVGYCNASTLDNCGIVQAVYKATEYALKRLPMDPNECEVFLDGGLKAPKKYRTQQTIIKGDQKIKVISAASILAKVTRDRAMCSVAKRHPQYGFEKHKGYGTQKHREMIQRHGLSDIHRRSFCKNIHPLLTCKK